MGLQILETTHSSRQRVAAGADLLARVGDLLGVCRQLRAQQSDLRGIGVVQLRRQQCDLALDLAVAGNERVEHRFIARNDVLAAVIRRNDAGVAAQIGHLTAQPGDVGGCLVDLGPRISHGILLRIVTDRIDQIGRQAEQCRGDRVGILRRKGLHAHDDQAR